MAQILTAIGAAVWWMVTFFMIPHMIIENKSISESFNSSKKMFFDKWGENVTAGLGIGMVTFFFSVIVFAVTFLLATILGSLWYIGLGIGVVAMALLIAWSNAAEQVAITALYLYSKNGKMPQMYQEFGVHQFEMGTQPM
jgi:hypothetical protein